MTEDPKSKLGRGLEALFEESARPAPQGAGAGAGRAPLAGGGSAVLPVSDLAPGPFQPRETFDDGAMAALIDSIRERGVIQPLIVRADPGEEGRYQIVAGERRWRAAQAAGLHEVPVLVQELSDAAALEVALIENIQRQDLTPVEEAEGYRRLTEEFDRTQDELSRALGKSRSHIANALRLLHLPDAVKLLLNGGAISAGHGRALLNAPDPTAVAMEIVRRNLTVRETERLIAGETEDPATPRPAPEDREIGRYPGDRAPALPHARRQDNHHPARRGHRRPHGPLHHAGTVRRPVGAAVQGGVLRRAQGAPAGGVRGAGGAVAACSATGYEHR